MRSQSSVVSRQSLAGFAPALVILFGAQSAWACSILNETPAKDYDAHCHPMLVCSKKGEPSTTCDGPDEKWHIKPCEEIDAETMKSKDGYWEGDAFYFKAKKQCPKKDPPRPPVKQVLPLHPETSNSKSSQ